MSLFPTILLPLDGSQTGARSVALAAWLATRLGARLHVLSATPRERPAQEELARLRVPETVWPLVTLHQTPALAEPAILGAIARHDIGLVLMTARGDTAETTAEAPDERIIGHVARAVIESSPVPVLLVPPTYRETLPWERVLVPVSGEVEADEVLLLEERHEFLRGRRARERRQVRRRPRPVPPRRLPRGARGGPDEPLRERLRVAQLPEGPHQREADLGEDILGGRRAEAVAPGHREDQRGVALDERAPVVLAPVEAAADEFRVAPVGHGG